MLHQINQIALFLPVPMSTGGAERCARDHRARSRVVRLQRLPSLLGACIAEPRLLALLRTKATTVRFGTGARRANHVVVIFISTGRPLAAIFRSRSSVGIIGLRVSTHP